MRISIIHPSRSRPSQAAATAKAWLSSAKDKGRIEYILSTDDSDPDSVNYLDAFSWGLHDPTFNWLSNENKTAIEAINKAAKFSHGDLIIQIADDFNQPPFHWDEYLLSHLEGKEDYAVKTQDGIQPTLITLPILDRTYYNRFGYIYHPDYIHMSSDVEFTAVAHMLGRVITLPIKIPHNHYSTGKTPKDAINIKNDATYQHGYDTMKRRLQHSFDLNPEEVVKPYSAIVWI